MITKTTTDTLLLTRRYLTCSAMAVFLAGCAGTYDASTKSGDGTTNVACVNACTQKTGNEQACATFAKDARLSCGELIDTVCKAEKIGGCGR